MHGVSLDTINQYSVGGLQGGGSYSLSSLSDRVASVECNGSDMSERFNGLANEVTLLRSKLEKCVTELAQNQAEHYASMLKLFNAARSGGLAPSACDEEQMQLQGLRREGIHVNITGKGEYRKLFRTLLYMKILFLFFSLDT